MKKILCECEKRGIKDSIVCRNCGISRAFVRKQVAAHPRPLEELQEEEVPLLFEEKVHEGEKKFVLQAGSEHFFAVAHLFGTVWLGSEMLRELESMGHSIQIVKGK
ncbi:MAG: hypothetical protein FJY98_00120 [Candidatus Liptonbacteria bacterium]|nr:hypothetical protein [Candidatus Liptonbacteria bacterium]